MNGLQLIGDHFSHFKMLYQCCKCTEISVQVWLMFVANMPSQLSQSPAICFYAGEVLDLYQSRISESATAQGKMQGTISLIRTSR